MRNIRTWLFILAGFVVLALGSAQLSEARFQETDKLRTPAKGSAERKAILDVLGAEYKSGQGITVQFQVSHLKVHNGWAWATVTALDEKGKAVGELWPSLLHLEDGKWVIKDLMAIAEALDDPVGPLEPSQKYLDAVMKKYPGVPADIFPKARQ